MIISVVGFESVQGGERWQTRLVRLPAIWVSLESGHSLGGTVVATAVTPAQGNTPSRHRYPEFRDGRRKERKGENSARGRRTEPEERKSPRWMTEGFPARRFEWALLLWGVARRSQALLSHFASRTLQFDNHSFRIHIIDGQEEGEERKSTSAFLNCQPHVDFGERPVTLEFSRIFVDFQQQIRLEIEIKDAVIPSGVIK